MTSPDQNPRSAYEKLYDWNVPLTDDEREGLLDRLTRQAEDDAEFNHPASRPPLPASLTRRTGRRALRHRSIEDTDIHAGRTPIMGNPATMGRIIHEELARREQI